MSKAESGNDFLTCKYIGKTIVVNTIIENIFGAFKAHTILTLERKCLCRRELGIIVRRLLKMRESQNIYYLHGESSLGGGLW